MYVSCMVICLPLRFPVRVDGYHPNYYPETPATKPNIRKEIEIIVNSVLGLNQKQIFRNNNQATWYTLILKNIFIYFY
jgi:hypothetical protein